MGPCRRAAPLLTVAAACTWPNPDFDAQSGSGGGSDSLTSGAAPTTGTPATTSSATTDGSDGLTASGGLTATSTGGVTTGPDPSTSSTSADSSGSSGAAQQPPEHLQHYVGGCDKPLWCYNTLDGIFAGSPARTGSSVCFTPATAPPFQLIRVGFHVAATFGDLSGDTRLQVQGPGPANLLLDQVVDPSALTPGYHEILLDPAPTLHNAGFCVGLVGGRKNFPGAGLGVAVDTSTLAPGQSFVTVDGGPGCDVPNWLDVAPLQPNPTGTWCIDADVTAQ